MAPTASSAPDRAPIHGRYAPKIDPADFVTRIDNRYLPYLPGTAFRYRGVGEDGHTPQRNDVIVTDRTRRVLGVDCTVVRDIVYEGGHQIQRTLDWYAQDRWGNVWYMGENTRDLKHGRWVYAIDSGPAGEKGAYPGIVMPGTPKVGDEYRQYYWPGHAVDNARVLPATAQVKVPYGTFKHPVVTVETSPLEPGVAARKFSVPGLGVVAERVVRGNREQTWLVKVTH